MNQDNAWIKWLRNFPGIPWLISVLQGVERNLADVQKPSPPPTPSPTYTPPRHPPAPAPVPSPAPSVIPMPPPNTSYNSKPKTIDAVKLEEFLTSLPPWASDAVKKGTVSRNSFGKWTIQTLEGPMTALDGDYLIRGLKGELYSCKEDIFKLTYETKKGK